MSTVTPDLLSQKLAWRHRIGIDKYDEMWEGVPRMTPAPRRSHQDIVLDIGMWLRLHWAKPLGNRAHQDVNVAPPGGWPDNYRVPDLVLLTPDRFAIDHDLYFEGAPTAVVEIFGRDDDTREKLPFYASLGVPEVWLIDRDTRQPEVLVLEAGRYRPQPLATDGWLDSPATGIRLRGEAGNCLAMQLAGNDASRQVLPET
jgi:Uma2 family endonuclease